MPQFDDLNQLERHLTEVMPDMQTEMPKAFYSVAERLNIPPVA